MNGSLAILTTLAVLLPSFGLAQEVDSESAEIDAAIDEVVVLGARDLASIRTEVVVAEDEVFALYNDLNDDDGYDIICKKATRIGSQIPRRICLARMYRDALAEATVDEDAAGITVGRMTRSSRHQEKLQEKMRALAIEHPELLAALNKRYALEEKFREERDRKYGN